MQRLGNLLWPFTFRSFQPGQSSEPLTSFEFLNFDCSVANVRWVDDTAHMFPLSNILFDHVFDKIGIADTLFTHNGKELMAKLHTFFVLTT